MKRLARFSGVLLVLMLTLIGIRHLVGYAVQDSPGPVSENEKQMRASANRIHNDAIVVDGHNDILLWVDRAGFDLGMNGGDPDDRSPLIASAAPFKWFSDMPRGEEAKTNTDLARLEEGGVDAQFFAVYESCKIPSPVAKKSALSRIKRLQDHERRYSDRMEIATTVDDIHRISSQGKLAALMGMEGGHMLDDELGNLAMFHDLGVRYMTLTHACSLNWADSATDKPVADGLSGFGKSIVKEMNRLGMMVDVSHVSDKTFWDAIRVSKAPIVATHSNARALCDTPRNLTDDMIRAIKENNGLIGVTFLQGYVDNDRKSIVKNMLNWYWFWYPKQPGTPLSKLIDHIDHIVALAGIDHVGIGSDFDGAPFFLDGLENVDQMSNLTYELVKRGYSEVDIKKILGGNFLRVMADVQKVAETIN